MKLSYCGLVDAEIKDSDQDLPLWKMLTSLLPYFQKHLHSSGFLKKQKKIEENFQLTGRFRQFLCGALRKPKL